MPLPPISILSWERRTSATLMSRLRVHPSVSVLKPNLYIMEVKNVTSINIGPKCTHGPAQIDLDKFKKCNPILVPAYVNGCSPWIRFDFHTVLLASAQSPS